MEKITTIFSTEDNEQERTEILVQEVRELSKGNDDIKNLILAVQNAGIDVLKDIFKLK